MSQDNAHAPLRSWSTPSYPDAATRLLSEQLEDARARREQLRGSGAPTDEVDREILELRRQLREGGQLRAGDALADGRYLLLERIGKGGFAVVWRALDRQRDLAVAIKVLHASLAGDTQRRERFFRGARVMSQLRHRAIVRVLEAEGADEGFYYFVMQFIPGGDLRQAVLDKKVPAQRVIPLILRIGEVLAEAHGKGFIHRDVKPANILLDARGEPRLTDFDLVGAADTTGGTRTGALGTFVYAAPESLDRPQDADARVDVYGLGMTTVFCLSGSELGVDVVRDAGRVIEQLPCTRAIQSVLKRATAWNRKDRYANASDFCQALTDAIVLRKPDPERESDDFSRPTEPPITVVRDSIASSPESSRGAAGASEDGAADGKDDKRRSGARRKPAQIPSAAIFSMLPPAAPGEPSYSVAPPPSPSMLPDGVSSEAALRAARAAQMRLGIAAGAALVGAALLGGYALTRRPAEGRAAAPPAPSVRALSVGGASPRGVATSGASPESGAAASSAGGAASSPAPPASGASPVPPASASPVPPASASPAPPASVGSPALEDAAAAGARLAAAPGGCPETMALIPAGSFTMGSTAVDESPPHEVRLGAYCIDRTEVTMERYRACISTPRDGVACPPTMTGPFCNQRSESLGGHPVNCVAWSAAAAYCAWVGGRLPTEAEWEYAARGAGAIDLARFEGASCWKRNTGAYANIGTCAAGSFPEGRSWCGLLDVAGNVAEWVQDWYGPYLSSGATNPSGPSQGVFRVVRGGAWSDIAPGTLSPTRRLRVSPFKTAESIGFRCARAPSSL